mmetsp:Transcript_206/g.660  ORF Transcript_206/g.660 Transcript_206/m.660 type:complete len:265 (+) Transcript_206:3338-4132(+)
MHLQLTPLQCPLQAQPCYRQRCQRQLHQLHRRLVPPWRRQASRLLCRPHRQQANQRQTRHLLLLLVQPLFHHLCLLRHQLRTLRCPQLQCQLPVRRTNRHIHRPQRLQPPHQLAQLLHHQAPQRHLRHKHLHISRRRNHHARRLQYQLRLQPLLQRLGRQANRLPFQRHRQRGHRRYCQLRYLRRSQRRSQQLSRQPARLPYRVVHRRLCQRPSPQACLPLAPLPRQQCCQVRRRRRCHLRLHLQFRQLYHQRHLPRSQLLHRL